MRFYAIMVGLIFSLDATAELSVDAWARATPPGATTGAIYGRFSNDTESDLQALQIEFEFSEHVMVHRTRHADGMARMDAEQLTLPAGQTLLLEPGALHIMLMGVSKPLVQGCEYSFSLTWEDHSTTQHVFRTGGFGQREAPATESTPCL